MAVNNTMFLVFSQTAVGGKCKMTYFKYYKA